MHSPVRRRFYAPIVFLAALAGGIGGVLAQEPPALVEGLVAYWRFDEDRGFDAKDKVGQNHLRLFRTKWLNGIYDGSLSFDGHNSYAQRNDGELLGAIPCKKQGGATSFSVAAWVRLYADDLRQPVVCKQGNQQHGMIFLIERNNRLGLEVFADRGRKTKVLSDKLIQDRKWHHVAATYEYVEDGTSKIRLYVDGKESGSDEAAVGPPMANSAPLDVGRFAWNEVYVRYLFGRLDELRLYDRALAAEEIAKLARQP